MPQLHRLKYSVDDHCGPEPRAEAQKEHAAPLVASERLHGSIIDNLDWTPECLAEIKSDPAAAQVVWLVEGASVDYRPGIADRDEAIVPVFGDALHIPHHFTGGHVGPEGILRSSRCLVASTLTCVPPTSITRTELALLEALS